MSDIDPLLVTPGNTRTTENPLGWGQASTSTGDDGNLNYKDGDAYSVILKGIHDVEYSIEETPVVIKLAATVTTFDKDRTPNLNDFIKRAESDIFDMVNRLRNIQSIY